LIPEIIGLYALLNHLFGNSKGCSIEIVDLFTILLGLEHERGKELIVSLFCNGF
jgi:hypothetical protein